MDQEWNRTPAFRTVQTIAESTSVASSTPGHDVRATVMALNAASYALLDVAAAIREAGAKS